MTNLLTLEIDNDGKILSIAAPENAELIKVLPVVGANFLSHWDKVTYAKLKDYLEKVFSTPHAFELSINLNFTIVDLTAFQYASNKAFVHCKYIETLPQPKSLSPDIKDWDFEKNINAFQNKDNQIDYPDARLFHSDIVENIALGIMVINFFQDGSFFISYTNKEFHKLAPTYNDKIHNKNNNYLFERTHPDDLTMVQAAVAQLFELKRFDIEFRMVDEGQTKNIRLLGKPMYNKSGDFITAYIYFQDITEKKKIEQELRLVDHAFNTAKLPMLFLTRDGAIYNYNEAICQLLGYSFEEFGKLTNIDFTTTFTTDSWRKRFDIIKAGLAEPFETKIRRKDHTIVDVKASSNAFEYYGIELVFVSFFDITEEIKNQEALKESEKRYSNLFNHSPLAKLLVDPESLRFTNVNSAAMELYGYSEEEFSELTLRDIIKEDEIPEIHQLLNTTIEEKRVYMGVFRHHKKSGEVIYVGIYSNKLDLDQKDYILIIAHDITERKKADEKLKLSDYIIHNATTAVYLLRADGSIYDFNEAAHTMLGYTKEEFAKLHQMDIDPTLNATTISEGFEGLRTEGKVRIQRKIVKKDGAVIVVEIVSNFIEYDGLELKCSFVTDITEKKELENLLKKVNELAKIGGWEIDVQSSTVFWSDITKEIHEVAPDYVPIIERGITFYKKESSRDKITEYLQQAINTGKSWDDELQIVTAKGNDRWIRVIGEAEFANGKCIRIYGSFQDIHEQKIIEQQKNSLLTTLEKSLNEIYVFDAKTLKFTYVNQGALLNNGYSAQEIMQLTSLDIKPEFTATTFKQLINPLVTKEKEKIIFFTNHKRKNGSLYPVEIHLQFMEEGNNKRFLAVILDITERKKAESKLIESENYLRTILDNEPECVKILNSKGELLSMNPAGLAMIEADNEQQVLGHCITDLVNTKYQLGFNQLRKEVFKGNAGTFEFEITGLKGGCRWLETHAVPLKDATGQIIQLLGVTRDITDRKKAEEDKKQLASRLLLATKSAQLGIWDWDLVNDTLIWDEGMYKLYGLSENEFKTIYEGWISRLHDEDRKEIDNEIQLAIANKKDYNTEFRVVWRDSSIHYIKATGIVERDDDGNAKRMIGVNWDVTLEKEEKQRLKLLESVIINTKDSILITEAEPFDAPGPRILFVNPAFTKMTGYTPEEVIGKTPRILQNEDTDRKELHKLRVALNKWESVEITVSNAKKNGEQFWNNFSMTPVANEKGWFTHWIAVERDVTKEVEAAIEKERMMKELLENNVELKQFSYITTHNLRAPLTNLILICQLLNLEKIEDQSTLQLIEAFKTSTHQLNDTLNDLINILIIKEKTDLKLEELSFQEILDKVKESISETLSNSKAIIEADFSNLPTVPFTKIYLESILLNLITNSIRYRHPERLPIIKIKTTIDPAGITKLIFSDNGIGMDMARVKHKIFGFHQRFHSNVDSKGIGLFLIKSQINALKGKIEVDSEVNVGTTFTIIFK